MLTVKNGTQTYIPPQCFYSAIAKKWENKVWRAYSVYTNVSRHLHKAALSLPVSPLNVSDPTGDTGIAWGIKLHFM